MQQAEDQQMVLQAPTASLSLAQVKTSGGNLLRRVQRRGRKAQRELEEEAAKRCRKNRLSRVVHSPITLAAVSIVGVYAGLRGAAHVYQQVRRRSLRRMLREVPPVLEQLGVAYHADFGTLLGMHREKDVIPYDNDCDMVLHNPDWDKLLPQLQERLPHYKVCFVVPREDKNVRWIRIRPAAPLESTLRAGVMDLFGGYYKPGDKVMKVKQGHADTGDVALAPVLPLGTIHFRGCKVPIKVPGDVPAVLRHRYGDDYMQPKYMEKGRDVIFAQKWYARVLNGLGKIGLRL